jgi:hypothetical protein
MHHFDLRVQFLAGLVLLISTTQQVETFLRFILLTLSIIYTLYKIYDRFKEKNKKDDAGTVL